MWHVSRLFWLMPRRRKMPRRKLTGKVESANERGKISDEDAAELIDKIVEIKRLTLEGEGKAEIRTEIAELKVMWRAALGNVNNSGDEQE